MTADVQMHASGVPTHMALAGIAIFLSLRPTDLNSIHRGAPSPLGKLKIRASLASAGYLCCGKHPQSQRAAVLDVGVYLASVDAFPRLGINARELIAEDAQPH